MKNLFAILLLSSLTLTTQASPAPVKVELGGISLGDTWTLTSAAVGATNIQCQPVTATPSIDQLCSFAWRRGTQWSGLPMRPEGSVGLMNGRVVSVYAGLPTVSPQDEKRFDYGMRQRGKDWKMALQEGNGEILLLSVDMTKRSRDKAELDQVKASPTFWAGGARDRSVTLFLGPFEMTVLLSEMSRP